MARYTIGLHMENAGRFDRLARDLKKVGATGLRRELYAGLGRASKPIREAIIKKARQELPSSGGLNERVATSKITAKAVPSRRGRAPSIRFMAEERSNKPIDVYALNVGKLRHPLFGNRRHWYQQRVKPGWFTQPILDGEETFAKELGKAIDDVERQISKG